MTAITDITKLVQGQELIRVLNSGEYTTDNPLWQKVIEDSYSFKKYTIQLKQE